MIHISEILVILAIILLLFGAGKFPKIMQNFAEGLKIFKKTINEKDQKPSKKKASKVSKKRKTTKKK